jgi:hypothetical protein
VPLSFLAVRRAVGRVVGFVAMLTIAGLATAQLACAADPAPQPEYWVDSASLGGSCDDTRAAAEAVSPATPWCSLSRAAAAVPLDGGIVRVRQADYPALLIKGRSYEGTLRLVAAEGEQPTLAGATLTDSHGVSFERLRITVAVNIGSSTAIALLNNRFDVPVSTAINLKLGAAGVTIRGNTIQAATGTGVNIGGSSTNPPISDIAIRDNHFDGIGRDAMQLKGFARVVVEGNDIEGVFRSDPTFHPDVIQTYDGGDGLLISGNYIHDNESGILVKDGRVKGLRMVNNVIARLDGTGYALQLFDAPGAILANNTFWGRAPVILRGPLLEDNKATLFNNVFASVSATDPALIGYADYNAIAGGSLLAGGLAPHSVAIPSDSMTVLDSSSFTPVESSPLIDAGTSLDAPEVDFKGRLRKAVATGALGSPDIGAAEYTPPGGFPAEDEPPVVTPTPTPTPTVTPAPPTASPTPTASTLDDAGGGATGTARPTATPVTGPSTKSRGRFKLSATVLRWTKRKLRVSVTCTQACRVGVRFKTIRAQRAALRMVAIRRGGVRVLTVRIAKNRRCTYGDHRCRLRAELIAFTRTGALRHLRLQRPPRK